MEEKKNAEEYPICLAILPDAALTLAASEQKMMTKVKAMLTTAAKQGHAEPR
jgi:hypothetical protein